MNKKSLMHIAAAVLAVAAMPLQPAALYTANTVSRPIGVQTTYYHQDATNSAGLQKTNFIEYTPNQSVMPVVAYGDGLYGRSTITKIAKYLEDKGMNVLGGINADFFVLSTGIPIGLVINNGTLISSDGNMYAAGFMSDGTAIINKPAINMKITGEKGEVKIDYYNKSRSVHGIYLLDNKFSNETKINTKGYNIVLERLEDTPVKVGGTVAMKVISKGEANVTSHIYENWMVLTVDEKGPVDRWVDFEVDDVVTLSVTPPENNTQWNDVLYAVGGKSLVENGQVTGWSVDAGSSNAPRSAVGVKADGTVVLYEVDGRQSNHSAGLTAQQLGQEMLELGVVNALCLDGGGSSAMMVQMPGNEDAEVVSKSSDGSLRACANYIFLVNKAERTYQPAHIALYPDYQYAVPGAPIALSAKATDAGFYPVPTPTDITYTVRGENGSVDGNIYTAGSQAGTVTIDASSADATGSHELFIINAIDALTVKKEGKTITSLSLPGGGSAELDVSATFQRLPVSISPSVVTWSVEGNIGTIDENGLFTAANSLGSGKIIASYQNTSVSLPVTVGYGAPQETEDLGSFENEQPYALPEASDSVLSVTNEYGSIYRGAAALQLDYDFSQTEEPLVLTREAIDISGLKSFMLRVKGLGDMTLEANFTDDTGVLIPVPLTISEEGDFALLTGEIPENAQTFNGFTVTRGTAESGSIWLDAIVASSAAIDSSNYPEIKITSTPDSVKAGETATIKAKITAAGGSIHLLSKNIVAKVDGVVTPFTYTESEAAFVLKTPALSAGMHRITIEAVTGVGNRTRKSVDITALAEGQAAVSFADTQGHWAAPYAEFIDANGIMQGEVKNQKRYFNPARNLTRAEFAVIMARYLKLKSNPEQAITFTDSDKIASWASDSIQAMAQAGLMMGSSDGADGYVYNPATPITRGEVITVIGKSIPTGYQVSAQSFTDSGTIPEWATPHVNLLVSLGIVGGLPDGRIAPSEKITRAEIAKLLYNLY